MDYKSHTKEEITQALKDGKEVWRLDTGNSGEDDMLIGTHDEVVADILHHHELDTLPEGWTLTITA
ncbi:hypothetical protein LCGC14_1042280 [marine sediment metagenome]|uniref:Uncharacterized protein n=1 Tax=marine sediment metagenome TaxID=412755 RepID=A0A0F9ND18_9ZZZZ